MRRFRDADAPVLWRLSSLPDVGATADPTAPLPLPPADHPPAAFPDLGDIGRAFRGPDGDFLVATLDDHLVAMGGIRRVEGGRALVQRVRVHPATRRRGVGRALMAALEDRARQRGLSSMFLDTAANQPEAMAFYEALGYRPVGRETRPEWTWTLVYYAKNL